MKMHDPVPGTRPGCDQTPANGFEDGCSEAPGRVETIGFSSPFRM
jgi:hypothetical protein